jgi:hypothetical protein
MRALVGAGMALGTMMCLGCSSGGGSAPSVGTEPLNIAAPKKPPYLTLKFRPEIIRWGQRGERAGAVTNFSLFADDSGAIAFLCVSVNADGSCIQAPAQVTSAFLEGDPDRPVIIGSISVVSMPNGLDGQPWSGDFQAKFGNDGTGSVMTVQLAGLNGQDTRGDGDPWNAIAVTGDAPLCIVDSDCARYGLDTSAGAYACVQNSCEQQAACTPAGSACSTTGAACCAATSCESSNLTACLPGETDCTCR